MFKTYKKYKKKKFKKQYKNYAFYPENWEILKKKVKERDNYTCKECGKKFPKNSPFLHVHHIKPLSKGGDNSFVNLVTLCWRCHYNEHKHLKKLLLKGKKNACSKNKNKKKKSLYHRKTKGYK